MEQVLINQNRHWQNKPYNDFFYRKAFEELLPFIKIKEILILTGIRRSGKSSIFKLIINELTKKEDSGKILFINCEDPHFTEVWNDSRKLYQIIETAEKLTQKRIEYLFIDEIQNINNWEKFIKSIYETGLLKKIFITGSNSNLLNSEYIKLLSGRFVEKRIFPLSFLEILKLNNIISYFEAITDKAKTQKLLETYLKYGSFPEVYKNDNTELKLALLSNYYQTIVLKDCILNRNIREKEKFKQLSFFLFNNVSSVYTYNSLSKATENNDISAQSYISALQESFAVYEVKNFSYSVKTNSRAKNKAYSIDNGLIRAVKYNFSADKGQMFENAVFQEIIKSGKFKVFFYNDKNECDFIIKSDAQTIAVQVVYELNKTNEQREFAGLEKVKKQFGIKELILVTLNNSGNSGNIKIMNFVDFCYFINKA